LAALPLEEALFGVLFDLLLEAVFAASFGPCIGVVVFEEDGGISLTSLYKLLLSSCL
jgi:hypothetical protein